jgi:hypothetical protein
MSSALTQIYALQQRELNEKERQRQHQIAKQQRVVAAFNTSGLPAIFAEFRDVPLRPDVRARVYKKTIVDLTYDSETPPNNRRSMAFASINGASQGKRWYCEEDPDSGKMRYCYYSGTQTEVYSQPQGSWLDHFIEYMAAAADPDAIARKIQTTEPASAPSTRRQLQPV